ncbi:alpha/beta fold hydrolase [Nonomuraea terrae]|uniref:alpha/beta fold hydrolase n=1 Tax=Nonomuraea terrae TaxID=2530383 RepID=UPI001FEBD19F|nr:alpha/beta fold hydrolase [Nonomuraea terrae]
MKRVAALVVALALIGVTTWLVWPSAPGVRGQDQKITVVDGPADDQRVVLDTTFFPPPEGGKAPAVLLAHGFGGSKQSMRDQAIRLAQDGYAVLTWSARGFGRSTGQIALNSPDYEVKDVKQLIDWLAERPEVQLDASGDPRVGIAGGSYGGAIALMTAAFDQRVDAIVPQITWSDLADALFPNAATTTQTAPGPTTGEADTTTGTDGDAARSDGESGTASGGTDSSASADPTTGGTESSASADPTTGGTDSSASADPTTGGTDSSASADPATGGTGTDQGASDTGSPDASGSGAASGVFKRMWAGIFFGQGVSLDASSLLGPRETAGPLTPQQARCGRFLPEICDIYQEVAEDGRASPEAVALLRKSSPITVADRIKAPTLLIQGQRDSLFPLSHADANAKAIAAAGTPVSLAWFDGGHDGGNGEADWLFEQSSAWFSRYLKGEGSRTPPVSAFTVTRDGGRDPGTRQRIRLHPEADAYPGLGGTDTATVELAGPEQNIVNPPGGAPASISTVPGIGGLLGGQGNGGVSIDMPGQSAAFESRPLTAPLQLTGSPTITVRVTGEGEATLFAKLYDVAENNQLPTLPAGLVAPVRVTIPQGAGSTEATITLPAVDHRFAVGHRLRLVVTTTDMGFATPAAPAAYQISLASPALTVPTVRTLAAAPTGVAWWVWAMPLASIVVAAVLLATGRTPAGLRRRPVRASTAEPASIGGTPETGIPNTTPASSPNGKPVTPAVTTPNGQAPDAGTATGTTATGTTTAGTTTDDPSDVATGVNGSSPDAATTVNGSSDAMAGGQAHDGATTGSRTGAAPVTSVPASDTPSGSSATGTAAVAAAEVPLEIRGLTKAYRNGELAVDGLSFRVEKGQVLGLLGPNGAGKTTTMRMMMGLIQPDDGEVRIFGERVTPGAPVLSRLGSFVEGPGFLPHLSGHDNIQLYWAATGRPVADAHFDEALEIAGLGKALERAVRTYSQGMRQRLAIAQAMLGLPDLLVLDEPTNGLDPPQIREMREVLKRYARDGRTVIVSSHMLAEVEQTCSHVVVMQRGRLVSTGPVSQLLSSAAAANGHGPRLEDVFLDLIGDKA